MPLYEYECDACGHRFEIIQKFSDTPTEKCPSCGGRVHKLMSSAAIQFKGSGWYITDYPKKGEASKSEGASDAQKETKGETKSSSSSDTASTPSPTPTASSTAKDSEE